MEAIIIRSNTGNIKATDSIFETIKMNKRFYQVTTNFYFNTEELTEAFKGYLTKAQITSTLYYLTKITNIKNIKGEWQF